MCTAFPPCTPPPPLDCSPPLNKPPHATAPAALLQHKSLPTPCSKPAPPGRVHPAKLQAGAAVLEAELRHHGLQVDAGGGPGRVKLHLQGVGWVGVTRRRVGGRRECWAYCCGLQQDATSALPSSTSDLQHSATTAQPSTAHQPCHVSGPVFHQRFEGVGCEGAHRGGAREQRLREEEVHDCRAKKGVE